MEGMMLPRVSDIPDSAFYCVECGPTNVGLGCDLPGHGEFALLADLPPRGVRECNRCAPSTVGCVHFDGKVVKFGDGSSHNHTLHNWLGADVWKVVGPVAESQVKDCETCGLRNGSVLLPAWQTGHPTKAEARAEFDRRVSMMLGREAQ